MKNIVLIGLGGAVGSVIRFVLGLFVKKYWGLSFPLGTFIVNLIGCFLIGMLIAYFQKNNNDSMKLLLITGFCGGFTTFSSFTAESIELMQNNQISVSLLYIGASICIGLLATWAGIFIMKG